ncbi:Na+/H+ antiporter subunit E [Streptomyces sp. RKND-216]|uniref:Na+/H+ antiporter subunit E n=1 Tax=Streptomyces sp. RKND-216 TaxID=2562581 RepID=UPI00109DC3AF|nr:Na+/H+ antiporter subunit E [Streptomyces sp. RKND-216]THA24016.1 Na+/H+ antiporter subunit E [Streptomyces sp. RKND-216]
MTDRRSRPDDGHGHANAPQRRPFKPFKPFLRRVPSLLWLWLLWLLLWGEASVLTVLGGLVISATVVATFPLPRARPYAAVRPLRLILLLVHVVVDVLASASTVAWEALRHGPRARTAVLVVRLSADTDFLIAATATLTTLTPGDLVVEIDRDQRLLYVHALPVRDRAAAERRRAGVARAEQQVLRALAPRGEKPRPEADPPEGRRGTAGTSERPGKHGSQEDPP